MPRVFTENERSYIADLVARNMARDYRGEESDGAESPMSGSERVKRHRIREKAELAVHDLVMVQLAGLLEEDFWYRGERLVREARDDLSQIDDEGERWWYAMGGEEDAEAQEVDIPP